MPCGLTDSKPNPASTFQTRVVTVSPGKSGAEKRTAMRFTARGSATPAAWRTALPANAMVQSPCTIRPGSPTPRANSSSRWIVSRSRRVAGGLILRDEVRDLGDRVAVRLESVVGRSLADSVACLHAAEELRHVLLVHELAALIPRLRLDDERRPVRAREQGDRCRTRYDLHAGLERPVEQHVLLVVHHEAANIAGRDRLGRRRDRAPYRNDREDRPSGDVVRRLRVRLHRRVGDLVRVFVPGASDRSHVEGQGTRLGHAFQAT